MLDQGTKPYIEYRNGTFKCAFNNMQKDVFETARARGFFPELDGIDLDKLSPDEFQEAVSEIDVDAVFEKINEEIQEAIAAYIKAIPGQDKHCPQYSNQTTKLADAVMTIMSLSQAQGLPLGGAIISKLKYNQRRSV